MCRLLTDRCPLGDVCGKNYKLLYKKNTEKECADQLAWHIYDRVKHPGAHTWEDALALAATGVVESTRDHEIYVDENGNEVDKPDAEEESDHDGNGDGGGGGGGGGGDCRGTKRKHGNNSRGKGGGGKSPGKNNKGRGGGGKGGGWHYHGGDGKDGGG